MGSLKEGIGRSYQKEGSNKMGMKELYSTLSTLHLRFMVARRADLEYWHFLRKQ